MVRANTRVIRSIAGLLRPDQKVATAVAKAMDTELRAAMRRQFDTEGGEGGDPWKPLSPGYKRRKDRIFSGAIAYNKSIAKSRGRKLSKAGLRKALGAENKILQLTGDMRRGFTMARDPGHVVYGYVTGQGRMHVVFGAQGKAYFYYHAEGTRRMPARVVLQISQERKAELQRVALNAMRPFVIQKVRALAQIKDYLRGKPL